MVLLTNKTTSILKHMIALIVIANLSTIDKPLYSMDAPPKKGEAAQDQQCEGGDLKPVAVGIQQSHTIFEHEQYEVILHHNAAATRALRVAINLGKHEAVIQALNDGADIHARFAGSGATALHVASHNGDLEMVNVLLAHGASLREQDGTQSTPLHIAAGRGHVGIVSRFIGLLADVDAANKFLRTPLHRAVTNGHVTVTDILLANGASVDTCDDEGKTPLHRAVEIGHAPLVRLLLTKQAPTNIRDAAGNMPIHYAVHLVLAKQQLPLADYMRWLEILTELLEHGADIDAPDQNNRTCFDYVIHSHGQHRLKLVQLLLQREVSLKEQDAQLLRPILTDLHYAVLFKEPSSLRALMEEKSHKSEDLETALALAAAGARADIVALLVDYGAPPLQARFAISAIIERLTLLNRRARVDQYRAIQRILQENTQAISPAFIDLGIRNLDADPVPYRPSNRGP